MRFYDCELNIAFKNTTFRNLGHHHYLLMT